MTRLRLQVRAPTVMREVTIQQTTRILEIAAAMDDAAALVADHSGAR